MDEVSRNRSIRNVTPPAKAAGTQLDTSERVARAVIMTTFITVLGFEAWLLG
jgi:predicted RND superfamily exporter protein